MWMMEERGNHLELILPGFVGTGGLWRSLRGKEFK